MKYSWVFLLLIPANPDNFFDFPTFVRIETSENGWTNNEIGFEWFKEIFVPQATEWNCHTIEQERANKQRQAADAELDQRMQLPMKSSSYVIPTLRLGDDFTT